MSNAETIAVPHLGTSTIGYKLGKAYDASLPTLVMVNSFTTSVEQYRPQFADEKLTATANLLAIEPYGHGETVPRTSSSPTGTRRSPTCRSSTHSASPRRSSWAPRKADG